MARFSELGIKPAEAGFIGDKIKISKILNREIIILKYRIETSKYEKGNGKRLDMQIEFGGTMHVVFTGSVVLQETIQRVPPEAFPLTTTIVEENERYQFT